MQLTEDQRNKLLKRDALSPTERRDNEFAVRNKLKEFLEFVPDANFILGSLPQDQIKKNAKLANVLNDQTTYGLFDLIFQLLNLLDFSVAYGEFAPYSIKEGYYPGPYASRYEAPITQESATKRDRTYPKLKPITPDEYKRLLYISEYIQALNDHYFSDLNMLNKIDQKYKSKIDTRPELRSFSTMKKMDKSGAAQYNARLLAAIKEFGPIPERELMLKLFIDPTDTRRTKAFSIQLQELEAFAIIKKDENGWRYLEEQEQEELAQKKGVQIFTL